MDVTELLKIDLIILIVIIIFILLGIIILGIVLFKNNKNETLNVQTLQSETDIIPDKFRFVSLVKFVKDDGKELNLSYRQIRKMEKSKMRLSTIGEIMRTFGNRAVEYSQVGSAMFMVPGIDYAGFIYNAMNPYNGQLVNYPEKSAYAFITLTGIEPKQNAQIGNIKILMTLPLFKHPGFSYL